MRDKKDGIILNFGEEPNSLSAVLIAYIKKNQEFDNSIDKQQNLIEDIIKIAGIDSKTWRVKEFKITPNVWGVTMKQKQTAKGKSKTWAEQAHNYQLKVEIRFERIFTFIEDSLKELIVNIPTFAYSSKLPKFKPGTGILHEIAVLDAHLAKLSWLQETGYRNYDLNIAVEDYNYAIDQSLNFASPFTPEKIIYIVGQDMYHMDNMEGKTTRGEHTLDVDGRITKVHAKAFEITLKSIYKCRAVAPVEIIWSPGNHDYLTSFMLCFTLKEHFKDDKFVTVDVGTNIRKARLWGNLLVGWTHRITGRYNTWGNELAQAFPELWGQSKFREWHHGDQHKKQDVKTIPTFTSGGVLCRQLTALSPVDKWHFENMFTDAIPGGESFLWSKDHGIFANFIAWTGQYEKNRNEIIKKRCYGQ